MAWNGSDGVKVPKVEEKNEIVVYQPNGTLRLEVLVGNETVWLTQAQLCELFGVVKSNVSYHFKNIYSSGELSREATVQEIRTVQTEGTRKVVRDVEFYNLDAIISLGFRINSKRGIEFRQWANAVIKSHLLQGMSINQRMIAMEDRVDRRLSKHDADIIELRKDVDFFISSSIPPKEKVFVEGKMLDAQLELTRVVKTAKKRIVLVDNYIDERTLMILGNRRAKVDCVVYTLKPNSPKLVPALANYAREYPTLPIVLKGYTKSHDRFLIIDNVVWHIGASLKDAGAALFAMMKMELKPDVILSLLKEG